MHLRRLLQLAFCVLVLVGISLADSMNDPRVIIGGGGSPTGPNTFTVIGNTFSFTADTGNSPPCTVNEQNDPDCSFINGNPYTWTSLTFFISPVQGNLSCDGGFFFAGCSVNDQLGIITFTECSGDVCGSGIGPGGFFQMVVQGFQAPTGFTGNANAVPEPASLVLMVTGVAALLGRRRSRRQ
jgi:hypothetical protein